MKPPSNAKHKRFCHEYMVDRVATQAAKRAGYSPKTSYQQGYQLLKNPQVMGYIDFLEKKRTKKVQMEADEVLQRLADIVRADPNEITQHRIGSCRYCWGKDDAYQWKTEREFKQGLADYAKKTKAAKEFVEMPNDDGGYGFKRTKPVNPDCGECEGMGSPYTYFADTTKLSRGALLLYAGVKETQHGIEVKTHDKMKTIEMIGKHLGMFDTKADRVMDTLAQALADIAGRGSKAPMAASPPPEPEVEP